MVREVTDFEKEVVQSKVPVVVDFWAAWCGPCKMLAPVFEKVAHVFEGKVIFAKVNVDEHPDVAEKVGVLNIPCVVFFKAGEEAGRTVGFTSEAALTSQVASWVKA